MSNLPKEVQNARLLISSYIAKEDQVAYAEVVVLRLKSHMKCAQRFA